ncbi:hypothetical protein J7E81_21680 [Bacillus sp. ISL-18]|uniref:DUF6470 family protein n=1 Tax=Bacillus sp. ISL-18 TaxID=2819118 RepID=UPI001BE59123|nr:DUF6470 family protein [Bacillus sp. ISL-18]MBT2657815.1 hypothetical protein [Bacillus sp. ISL-18]
MPIPQISITQTNALIGLRTTQPVQEIEQPAAELSIKQTPAAMTIDRKPSEMIIDQEEAWNQLGFKPISVLTRDIAEFSQQEALEAIAETAQEGDQLASIEHKGDAIVSIAEEKGNPPPADFTIAFIPSYGSVHIQYNPAEIQIDWKLGGAEVEAKVNKPVHHYTPGKTEVYMRQMQSLKIDFVGGNVNRES